MWTEESNLKKREKNGQKEKGKVDNFKNQMWNIEVFDIKISNVITKLKYDEWN